MSFPYTQAAGSQDYQAFGHLGFRYLEIPGAGEEITVADVTATVVHTEYPEDGAATFESSDDTLDAVWDLMTRSLQYSVQETFVDTPTREQGQFLHDTVNISYGLMATEHDRVATRQAIREFMLSQQRYWTSGNDAGRYNAVYPNGDGKRDIPDFTEVVPDWIWRYFLETGDRALLADVYDNLSATAGYIRRHIATTGPTQGLVTQLSGGSGAYQYGIVDWPMHGRFDYDMTATARTTVNALGVDVLRKVALAAEALGRPAAEVQAYVADADALADRMNETLRSPRRDLRRRPARRRHAELARRPARYVVRRRVRHRARGGPARAGRLPRRPGHAAGPDDGARPGRGAGRLGCRRRLLDLLTNEDDYGWAGWLADGGTFTPEAWELSGSANSASHGWGSNVAVDVLDSGARDRHHRARRLRGDDLGAGHWALTEASGSRMTQRGPRLFGVGAMATRPERLWRPRIPVNVEAVVELPSGEYDVTAGGAVCSQKDLGTDDGVTRYRVGSGTWTFVSR